MNGIAYDAELRIPSDLVYLRAVRAFVRELAESFGFYQEKVVNIELATDEIFSNAIEHGSCGLGSAVIIRFSLTDEAFSITISDSGQKSDPNEKWLSAWSNVIARKIQFGTERGHGLFLAYNLTDEMRMEPNSSGGLDVYLLWYIGRGNEYKNSNSVNCGPQVAICQTEDQKVYESSKL